MSRSIAKSGEIDTDKNYVEAHPRPKGLIAFCETKLRYEKGFKAWIFLGPYLLGVLGWEMLINADRAQASAPVWPWVGFLAYLVLFPPAWQRILKFVAAKKTAPGQA